MLKVSQTKVKITPEGRFFPVIMLNGHWSEGVADDQYASIMVLEVEEKSLIWICLDALGTGKSYSNDVRKAISEKFSVPFEHINIGYTHSHSAMHLSEGNGIVKGAEKLYCEFVKDRILDGVERCLKQGLEEVRLVERCADGLGFYSNRNGFDKVGDTEIKVLEFHNLKDEIKGLILCYACHATVVNFQNTRSVNSDLGGILARGMEARTGVYPLIMLGAAGDMSNRCCRQGNDYNELIRVGEGLLKRIDEADEEKELKVDQLSVDSYRYQKTFVTTKEMRHAQIEKIYQQIQDAKTADLKRVFESALAMAMKDPDGIVFDLDLEGVIVRLGDIEVCTMPAELFSCLGLKIKEAMPVKCPVFWGYSNYSVGYLYNREEAGLSFESAATNIPAGIPEEITEMICHLVK